jgi:hypothetical protein
MRQNNRLLPNIAIKFCINFYPFDPKPEIKQFYATLLDKISPKLLLSTTSTALYDLPKEVLLVGMNKPRFDAMFIYDFISFKDKTPIARDIFEQLVFHKTHIFTPRRIDPKCKLKEGVDYNEVFTHTAHYLNICFESFTYVDFDLIVE